MAFVTFSNETARPDKINSRLSRSEETFDDRLFQFWSFDVGHGSTSVCQWLPAGNPVYVMPTMTKFVERNAQGELVSDGTLFNGMMKRIHQLGKHSFRALLWHQGESDSHQEPDHQISAAMYRKMMVELIRASRKDAGWNFPWFVAEATYQPQLRRLRRLLD